MFSSLRPLAQKLLGLSMKPYLYYGDVQILYADPEHSDAIKMEHYAVDAYNIQSGTGAIGSGDFSDEAREMAVRTVSSHFGISESEALERYDIYITPGPGFHGHIFALAK